MYLFGFYNSMIIARNSKVGLNLERQERDPVVPCCIVLDLRPIFANKWGTATLEAL
jgi:hypothetical protein